MPEPSPRSKVALLRANLASRWAVPAEILAQMPALDQPAHREAAIETPSLDRAVADLTAYLTTPTWFDLAAKQDGLLQGLRTRPVAYFCAEFGLADWLPIFSGGLGVLAGDVLKEASDLGVPMVGIGLLYRHGFFTQRLDAAGNQREDYPTVHPEVLPLEAVPDAQGNPLTVSIPMGTDEVGARAWRLAVGRLSLYLLDTDLAGNQPDQRVITANLYGGDRERRIQQEIVLGIGGVRLLHALGIDPGVYSMNEGHAAFLGLELLAQTLNGKPFEEALADVRGRIAYTNHTVLPAGNEVFSRDLVRRYLAPAFERRGIDQDRLLSLGGTGDFSMTELAFRLAGKANAVSRPHAEVMRQRWPDFTVEPVTNGVHAPTWVGPRVRALLDREAPGWSGEECREAAFARVPPAELWKAHRDQHATLMRLVTAVAPQALFDPDALTMVWARRFAQYKRAGLLASDVDRLRTILRDPDRPVQLIIAGKAHPADEAGKAMMRDLLATIGAAGLSDRVAFIPDYRLEVAATLTAGADLWINTPRKPLEASGTSGMKAGDNGALLLTVLDGWASEVEWHGIGWTLAGEDDGEDAARLYDHLEREIVPTFFRRDSDGTPGDWAERMRRTLALTLSRYSTRRMLHEYLDEIYLPLIRTARA